MPEIPSLFNKAAYQTIPILPLALASAVRSMQGSGDSRIMSSAIRPTLSQQFKPTPDPRPYFSGHQDTLSRVVL